MKRHLFVIAAVGMLIQACGGSKSPVMIGGNGGEDSSGLTSIDIGLPDRTSLQDQVADIDTKMNGFQLVVSSSGAGCTNVNETKEYADKTISASLKQGCDYDISLSLGNLSGGNSNPDNTAPEKTTYEKDVKSIFASNCVTCHAAGSSTISDYSTFANIKGKIASVMSSIESGSMPKNGSLSAAEKETIAKWKADGYLEKAEPSQNNNNNNNNGPKTLASVYYKNNVSKKVASADITGKASISLAISLQLQDAGRAIGLGGGSNNNNDNQNNNNNNNDNQNNDNNDNNSDNSTEPQIPADRNFTLSNGSETKTLSKWFKGDYMMVDFSTSSCGYCIQRAKELNQNPGTQALINGEKCSHVTIVPKDDLGAWHRMIGGGSSFVGKHSYNADTARIANLVTTLTGSFAGTPTFVIIDRQGQVVGDVGHGIPTSDLQRLCR